MKKWLGLAMGMVLVALLAGAAFAQGWGQQMGPGMMGYPCQGMGPGMGWGQMGPGMMGPGMMGASGATQIILHVNPWGGIMPYGGPWRRGV